MVTIDDIRDAVGTVALANGAHAAWLFGSFARGTATARSDVDLIFIESTEDRFLDRLGRYLEPLTDRIATAVEVLVYTPDEFARMQERPFIVRALREGILLYESRKAA